jgi:hypothetical protein
MGRSVATILVDVAARRVVKASSVIVEGRIALSGGLQPFFFRQAA